MAERFSPLATPSATQAVLAQFGHAARYKLGQNFLVNDHVVGKILTLAELEPKDVVLEVGPGIGTLTLALLPRVSHVVAIEHDSDLLPILSQTTAEHADGFFVIHADALQVGEKDVLSALPEDVGFPNKLVANLPYNVAATIILKYFQEFSHVKEATVMVQSEVADRICSAPDSKTYGAYTVKLSLYAEVVGRFQVTPDSFLPAPRVQSAVVKLARRVDPSVSPEALKWTAEVVDAAFSQRRKTIRNSMKGAGFDTDALDEAFEKVGIDSRRRAETLTRDDFVKLSTILHRSSRVLG